MKSKNSEIVCGLFLALLIAKDGKEHGAYFLYVEHQD